MTEHQESAERRHPRRLIAAREIADTERNWSAARAIPGNEDIPLGRVAQLAVRQTFYELVEVQGFDTNDSEAVLGLFADTPELTNATLARIDMDGRWDAADSFERELLGMLFDTNYRQSIQWFNRSSDEAKRTITIPAGFTKEENFVALRRKRRLVMASHLDGADAKRLNIEVDKVSTFALDISKLGGLDDPAVAEVRLIVAATIFKAIDWDVLRRARPKVEASLDEMLDSLRTEMGENATPFKNAVSELLTLRDAMRRNNLSIDEVRYRAYEMDDPARLRDARGLGYIEEALRGRSDLLTPAATTYYVHS